jgi:succinoglycan biosynthesis protein ExoV
MEILSVTVKTGNVGDDLNQGLWQMLMPDCRVCAPDQAILGIGTMGLGTRHDQTIPSHVRQVHVLGSGAYHTADARKIHPRVKFHFVRGPLSARVWGCEGKGIVDGAFLLRETPWYQVRNPTVPGRIGYIPHHFPDRCADFDAVCEDAGLYHIRTAGTTVEQCIAEITSCESVISEALHGAVLAELFRVPWKAVYSGSHVYQFKWQDWFHSIDRPFGMEQVPLACSNRALLPLGKRLANRCKYAVAATGFGNSRWLGRPFRVDSQRDYDALVHALQFQRRSARFLLSPDSTVDRLCQQAAEAYNSFRDAVM